MSTEFLPFGELFIEERTTWNTPYKFSGKELDEETGYSYFGARYYDPNISIWLSVDPLSDEYPSHSPFNYTLNNPILLIDPNGTFATKYEDGEGNTILETKDGSKDVVVIPDDHLEDFQKFAKQYEQPGMKASFDSKGWNGTMKADILGFETTADMEGFLGIFNTQWSRQNAIDYLQGNGSAAAMYFSEALSQWTNPELVALGLSAGVAGYSSTISKVDEAAASVKNWLGDDYRSMMNKSGDNIFMSKDGFRKMRFDLKNTHKDRPHIHLEHKVNGKWKDATEMHRIYPRN